MSRPLVDPDLRAVTTALIAVGGRPRDRADLDELRAIHGELPIDPLPGVDDA